MTEKWNEIILINNINLRSLNYIELPSYSSLLESWSTQTLLLGYKESNQVLYNHFFYSRQCLLD